MADYWFLSTAGKQAADVTAERLRHELAQFVAPLLARLDAHVDKRLVRTFLATLETCIRFRHSTYGLLLSELGGQLLDGEHAPAGTKRLSNLLRSPKWQATLLTEFLWEQADQRLADLQATGVPAYLVWDESELEHPESQAVQGLGPVRSSHAARLTRRRKGYFRPPAPPVVVPGQLWLAGLLVGPAGPPTVATMRWFVPPRRGTSPAPTAAPPAAPTAAPTAAPAGKRRPRRVADRERPADCVVELPTVRREALAAAQARWGRQVLHVFDRGYAGAPWLAELRAQRARFVLRWPKRYHLVDAAGQELPAWQIARGKKPWGHRRLWDARAGTYRQRSVLAFRVTHPAQPEVPLWLVVVRTKGGGEPWYLLTNEPVHTERDAWAVARAYVRRWEVEQCFRYEKTELALESPRLWLWETRVKLLLMLTLVYAFLLRCVHGAFRPVRDWLLRFFCHRTGRKCRQAKAPLYRLRAAFSELWTTYRVWPTWTYAFVPQNSG